MVAFCLDHILLQASKQLYSEGRYEVPLWESFILDFYTLLHSLILARIQQFKLNWHNCKTTTTKHLPPRNFYVITALFQ